MTILTELRNRLVRAMMGLIPGMVLGWLFVEQIFDALKAPLTQAYTRLDIGDPQIIFTNPTDAFVAYLQIAVVTGILTG
ncbi:MAG: preprotein translocase subunit TatC, partial [Cytophagales bacterium]|nr:preprotein translocase subunit TatC [Cytophagales bacterium]